MTPPSAMPSPPFDPAAIPVGELATTMGIAVTEMSETRAVATMPVVGNRQPFGLLHGGANAALAETIGSVHAAILAGPDRLPVGVELSCTHHRAVTAGIVTAVCEPLHVGRTVSTFQITIRDDRGRASCTARLTCILRPAASADS